MSFKKIERCTRFDYQYYSSGMVVVFLTLVSSRLVQEFINYSGDYIEGESLFAIPVEGSTGKGIHEEQNDNHNIFKRGNQTKELLKHVIGISMDPKAYQRCLAIHPHCYDLGIHENNTTSGEVYYMTQAYLDMLWKRVKFLLLVVEHGYNFIFTDCDILWFRNPFSHFYTDVDFQIACDVYTGNPTDLRNLPNGGFTYVISNNRTIEFYQFWYASRHTFPGLHDQDVFNKIKFDPFITKIGLKIRFLDTMYFGGFCQPSKDLNQVCTMHANCCCGLENKIYDLKILLQDWTRFSLQKANRSSSEITSWTAPQKCLDSNHPPDSPKKKAQLA